MKQNTLKFSLIFFISIILTSCSSDEPGPIAGTWKLMGPIPMIVKFRKGESESMGLIEKVSYKVNGNSVIVTSESGPMKGISVKYTVDSPNTLTFATGKLQRVR